MLRKLHNKKTQKKIYLVLIIGVGLPFLFWGTTSSIRGRKPDTFQTKLFGKKISQQEYDQALKNAEIQLRLQFGESYAELQKYINLKSLAFQRLVLIHEAKQRKIKISDEELINSIKENSAFQKNGRFDERLYEAIVKYELHLLPRTFEEFNRETITLKKLADTVTKGISVSDAEILEVYKKENEQLSVNYIAAIPADFQKDITPQDEELKMYFSEKKLDFKLPLSFNLEYLVVDSQELLDTINLRLDKRESLETISKENSLTIKETGLFGQTDPIPGIGWQPQVSGELSKLKTGQILPAQEIDKRYYIFRLKEIKQPYVPEYLEVKDKVQEAFVKDKAREIAKEKALSYLNKLKTDFASNSKDADFAKNVSEFALKSSSTDLFKFGSYIEGIGASDKIFSVAKNLKEKEFSDLIEMPSGFYIIWIKSKSPISEEKFTEEKDKFSKKLLEQKKEEFFTKYVEELLKKAGAPS